MMFIALVKHLCMQHFCITTYIRQYVLKKVSTSFDNGSVGLGSGRKNYSCEAANLLCNLNADFPKYIAYVGDRHTWIWETQWWNITICMLLLIRMVSMG